MTEKRENETVLYIIGWVLIALFSVCVIWKQWKGHLPFLFATPCLMHTVTGAYCPGCGGTRAVESLLHGEIVKSVCYHPIVLYGAVLGIPFMVTQTIARLCPKCAKIAMNYHAWYIWVALVLIVGNFAIKNIALFVYGIDLMPCFFGFSFL